ncbi:thiamine pyrophosphate-binding protein [Halobellus salinisoli]|uniref:thiamine pyrophosphate-binding protein n=1 Tax=Halobellus salinisoli TaxID=3108500 RepID=UPI00300982EE
MTGNQILLEILEAEDVTTAFSLLSEELMGITMAAEEEHSNIEIVQTRHEQSAVAMADGYARVSDEIGVAVIGRGPAIAQTGTALTTAYNHGSNILVIIATRPRHSFNDELNKGFRQESFIDSLVDEFYTVWDEETFVPSFADAFRKLHADSGPVVVQIPWDILDAELGDKGEWRETSIGSPRPDRSTASLRPNEDDVVEAATMYETCSLSNPPVILAGAGAVKDDAGDAIESLAKRLNAVIVTTMQARSFLADHPYMAGFVGGLGDPNANAYLKQSEFVLALGASLNNHTTQHGELLAEGITIQSDIEPAHLDRYSSVDLSIVGGATAMAEALDNELDQRGINEQDWFWTDTLVEQLNESPQVDTREFSPKADCVDPRALVSELDSLLPDERIVVTDSGQLTTWVINEISITQTDDFIWPMDFGSIGLGQPIALGAAHYDFEKPVIVFCGDGGFQMSLQELNTAVRSELPLIIVVINDGALGAEYQRMRNHEGSAAPALIDTPDFETIAEGFGARAHTIRSLDDLGTVAEDVSVTPFGPIVLDCKVDQRIQIPKFDPDYESESGVE